MFTPPGGRRKKQPLAGGKHRGVVPPGVQRIAQASPAVGVPPAGQAVPGSLLVWSALPSPTRAGTRIVRAGWEVGSMRDN